MCKSKPGFRAFWARFRFGFKARKRGGFGFSWIQIQDAWIQILDVQFCTSLFFTLDDRVSIEDQKGSCAAVPWGLLDEFTRDPNPTGIQQFTVNTAG